MEEKKGFMSITGWRVNDPSICIKGNGNFACVCPDCQKEFQEKIKEMFKDEKETS